MKKILLTGGTGFFGKSILDMLKRGSFGSYEFTILSRDPEKFLRECPEFADLPQVTFISGDVRDFDVSGCFDYMIMGATPASTEISDDEMRSIIIDGTKHSLDIARKCSVEKILFISSGAVYGKQTVSHVPETAECHPVTAYGIAKLEAENLCFSSGIPAVAARCFAFTGKYLKRNIHFAIGNFIRDALNGNPIIINGDGTPLRSYLYADDLVVWLFDLLEKGISGQSYNVGSSRAVSIAELAHIVAAVLAPRLEITVKQKAAPDAAGQPYVPDISKSQIENMGSEKTILETAIKLSAE